MAIDSNNLNRDVKSAVILGGVGAALDGVIYTLKQRDMIKFPEKLDEFAHSVSKSEIEIQQRMNSGIFDKFMGFIAKPDLSARKDMLQSITENQKISLKGLGKKGALAFVNWAVFSLAISAIFNLFNSKKEG